MIIDCDPLTIPLYLPECAGEGPFTATLTRDNEDLITLVATLDEPTQRLTLSGVPAATRRGVWLLSVITSCGCYSSKVFLDLCRTPRFVSTHTPTPGTDGTTVCCDPEGLLGHVVVSAAGPYPDEQTLTVDGDTVASATLDTTGMTLSVTFSVLPVTPVTLRNSYGDVLQAQPAALTVVFTFAEPMPCDTYSLAP